MSDALVLTDLDGDGVLTVTMNRPSRRNAFNSDAFLALRDAFTDANADPKVAVVLPTGAGDDFSSGARPFGHRHEPGRATAFRAHDGCHL